MTYCSPEQTVLLAELADIDIDERKVFWRKGCWGTWTTGRHKSTLHF